MQPGLPAIPSLPMRSPWETMLGQAIAGLDGVTITDRGIALVGSGPRSMLRPETDLDHEAFGGMRAFIEVAGRRTEPVKWQVTGPVTLGLGLLHAGLPATRGIRDHRGRGVGAGQGARRALAEALPRARQLVVIDEPGLTGLAHPGFPLEPRQVVDLLGTCARRDHRDRRRPLLRLDGLGRRRSGRARGVVDARRSRRDPLRRRARGLPLAGGRIAWGAIPTDGPRADSVDRYWRALAAVWCELVRGGCDPVRLRTQAIVTPECGLAPHTVEQAEQLLGLTQEIADRVLDQAVANGAFSLGA